MKFLIFLLLASLGLAEWVKEMENSGLYEGDIVLDPDEREFSKKGQGYASIKGGRWPDAKVPYVITSSIGSHGRSVIQAAFREYHEKTCLRFVPRTRESAYISFHAGSGCSSPVGYRYGRMNSISLGRGCQYLGTTMHEIGHSIGLYHEQSRPDRDSYIEIIWNNIQSGMSYNFNKHSTRTIDSLGTPYDFRSMMHYSSTAFGGRRMTIKTKNPDNQKLIGQRGGFSKIDVIQINKMYCGGVQYTTKAPTPFPTQPPGGCVDFDNRCKGWADDGFCNSINKDYKRIMDHKCCASCKDKVTKTDSPPQTERPGYCVNTDSQCDFWASNGYCPQSNVTEDKYRKIMEKKCCKACREKAQCRDRNTGCGKWADRGECKYNPKYMHSWCRKACALCH